MSDIVQLIENEADFNAAAATGTVLIDFFATWCRPCRQQLTILDTIAPEVAAKAKIIKVDTDKVKAVAEQWGVQSIPTLFLVKDGKKIQQFVGLQQPEVLKDAINKAG